MTGLGMLIRLAVFGGASVAAVWGGLKVRTSYRARNRRSVRFSTVQGRRGALYAIGFQHLVSLEPGELSKPAPAEAIRAFQVHWSQLADSVRRIKATGDVADLLLSVEVEPTGEWSDDTFEALEKAMDIVNLKAVPFTKVEIES